MADGVIEEFESAQRLGRIVIPIFATGGTAAQIWDRLNKSGALPPGLARKEFDQLNDAGQSASALAKIVETVMAAADKRLPRRKGKVS